MIMPMDAPGIEIRPIRTMLGEGEFSEVYLDDVPVPLENRVGKENDGWRVTNVTLRFERGTAFASEIYQMQEMITDLARLAKRVTRKDACAWDEDAVLRREVGHLRAELEALWAMLKLSVSEANESGMPGLGGSAIKLCYTELYQRVGDLAMRLLGRMGLARVDVAGLPSAGKFVDNAMHSLSLKVAAGTSQIQRNIIAERILGLPREAR